MSEIRICDGMTVNLPEGFHQMDESEKKQHFNGKGDALQALLNPSKRMIIAFTCKKLGWLASKIATPSALRVRYEVGVCRANPGLKVSDEYDIKCAGLTACGFSYAYSANSSNYVSNIVTAMNGRKSYTVSCTCAAENAEYAKQELKKLLEGAKLDSAAKR